MKKKLSVITVNLNNAEGLRSTIKSILKQTFRDFEYIVIDGGSTDGSLDIIKEHADNIDHWVSEKDKGIYNAMNKAILKANGEYCLFMNSGDIIISESGLEEVFSQQKGEDILYADVATKYEIWRFPEKMDMTYLAVYNIGHSATFIKRCLFDKIGLYNEGYKIVADFDFILQAILKQGCSYKHIPVVFSFYDITGISSTNKALREKERLNTLKKHFPDIFPYLVPYVETHHELIECQRELEGYRKGELVQMARRMQRSFIYKLIRRRKRKREKKQIIIIQ